jgi:ATP-binding cassette subfamily F protein 3
MLLQLQSIGRRIGGRWLFRDATLVVRAGDRIGLVGPNGAGKSTMLKHIAGDATLDSGEISIGRGVRLGMLRQEIDPRQTHSVQAEAATALARLDELEAEMRALELQMTEAGERGEAISAPLAERYDQVSTAFDHGGGFGREGQVARVLAGLGFDEEARERPLSSFSGGWLMRVELAKLFLAQPDVLLLDEPTNHLDLPAIQWFEETIANFPGALVIVSHDRTFLRKHVSRVLDLDGLGGSVLYEGGYDRYLAQRAERREQLLARKANQDREIAQMERFVERFRAKATKAKQAQSRMKALDRIERIEVGAVGGRSMRLKIPPPPRSGEQVITQTDIQKAYGDKKVYTGVDIAVRRGERVALAGPNGAGKSTLLRIVAGALDIDAGERRLGHNVQVAFFAQHQLESLDERASVLEELERSALTEDVPRLRGHLGAFLFSGDDVDKKISVLSGGEKARVALAKMLLRPANLLVLDEPTNHLDIQSCEVLEQALQSYEGSLVFVSHDRAFINALAGRVVEVKYGVLREFSGNYDEYLRSAKQLEQRASKRTTQPDPPAADNAEVQTDAKANAKSKAKSKSKSKRAAQSPQPSTQAEQPSAAPTPSVAPAPKASKADRQEARERRKKRDKVRRQVERIEADIQKNEKAIEALDWRLGDPKVYSDTEQVAEIQTEKLSAKESVDALYADWERRNDELTILDELLDEA